MASCSSTASASASAVAVAGSLDPEYYKKTPIERFNKNNDLEDIMNAWKDYVKTEDWIPLSDFVIQCLESKVDTPRLLQKAFLSLRRKHKKIYKKNNVLYVLRSMEGDGKLQNFPQKDVTILKSLLVKKAQKSTSGVLVVTVITSPYPEVDGKKQKFSCEWNCYYCPNEPDQPRSYLHDEPSVLRANRNDFDAVLQFYDRTMTLLMNGHPADKIELLVLGGTWSSYPVQYQESFIRDLFFAANTFFDKKKREKFDLMQEKLLNEKAQCKIIGITLETRPDCITLEEIKRYRRYGCTRVQLGIQHTSDRILKKINRGSYRQDVVTALKLLKDACYKIDIHIMPNLPGASPEIDKKMFLDVLYSPALQADQWKLYPCEVVPWTIIQKWFESGEYVPYEEESLIEVLKFAKRRVHPWIRLNRVIRDIPSQYILGGVDRPSMRQEIAKIMEKEGRKCRCIRCREVRDKKELTSHAVLKVRKYFASEGLEYFISFETEDENTIFGFTRLRIPPSLLDSKAFDQSEIEAESNITFADEHEPEVSAVKSRRPRRSRTPAKRNVTSADQSNESDDLDSTEVTHAFPELKGCALVRELHVYGQLVPVVFKQKSLTSDQQHVGFGTRLMQEAERMAKQHEKVTKVAVISGVGVRNFYRKIGYHLEGEGEMMIKHLRGFHSKKLLFISLFAAILTLLLAITAKFIINW